MADAERARQALADFRRGPIKRSKLHPKDKVKSFQSPQLFGPQNGAAEPACLLLLLALFALERTVSLLALNFDTLGSPID